MHYRVEFKTCWSVVASSGLVDQFVLARLHPCIMPGFDINQTNFSFCLHLKKKVLQNEGIALSRR